MRGRFTGGGTCLIVQKGGIFFLPGGWEGAEKKGGGRISKKVKFDAGPEGVRALGGGGTVVIT